MSESFEFNPFVERIFEPLRRHAGPLLLSALADPDTIEVMLNPDGRLWQEKLGEEMKVIGTMEAHRADAMIRTIASCLNKNITYDNPLLNGEFPLDGSRFSAVIPPVVARPAFAIRRKASRVFTLDDYVTAESMSARQKEALCDAVANRMNILVIGSTSSGKTTLTNALINEMIRINPTLRAFIFEDTGEIQCSGDNAVFFHTTEVVGMMELLKNPGLRMRPDVICLGEVRDHAALDLMDCWNTGHNGGVSTLHANSAADGLTRLRGLVTRHPHAPSEIEEVIGLAVQRIVFIHKTPEGRKVKEILGVDGYSRKKREYELTVL